MVYVFLSYNYSPGFDTPESWIKRTAGYTGILEGLAKKHVVYNVKQINYKGVYMHNGVRHHFVKLDTHRSRFPIKLHRYIKSLNPDVVVFPGLHEPLKLIQLGLMLKPKTRIMVHNHAEKPFNRIRKYLQRMADHFVYAYMFASKPMGLEWVERGNLPSAEKIYEVMEVSSVFEPVDRTLALSKTGISGERVFLWVGRLNDNKGPLNVVSAFLKFANKNPAARLYMIYHTDELLGQIHQLLAPYGAESPVIMKGQIPHDELLYWFNSADFILSGSHYEGSGTAVCEAMSCGCVPVVTDILSFRMITNNGQCGILYEAGNEQALLNALQKTREMNRENMRGQVLAYYHSTLSFTAIARRFGEIAGGSG